MANILRKSSRTNTVDMTRGPIVKQILMFALPLMVGNIFQMLYNAVDSIVVGNFVGTQALAAIGNTAIITNLAIFFFNGFSIGAGVVIGNHFGARDLKGLHTAVETTMATTFVLCIAFTIVGILGAEPLLHFMATPDDVFEGAAVYLKIYFAGISGLLVYNIGSGILRAVGDTTRPLYFLILTSIMNIVLDLVFVLGFHTGIAGAAIATIISQMVSAILTLRLLIHTTDIYRLTLNDLKISGEFLKQILVIGLPAGVQSAITAFSNIFVQSYVNYFGSVVMAGWASYNKLNMFIMLPMSSVAMAATTFVSQNTGAKQPKRSNTGTLVSLVITEVLTAAIATVIFILAEPSVGLFSPDPEVIRSGAAFVRTNTYFLLFNCINHVLAGALRGRGDSTGPMVIMLISFVAIRQVYLFVLTHYIVNQPLPVGFGYPVGWMCCCVIELVYFFMRWKKPLVSD